MKRSIIASIALTAFVGMAADYQTLSSVCDLGTFTPTATMGVYFQSNTTNESYALSQDADFSALDFYANSGSVFFDFSDGNHAIKVKSFRAANRNAPWVILKGGTWDLGTGSGHDFRFGYNTEVGGRTILLDSCTVTNADFMHGITGTNNTLVLQNGSCLYAKTYRLTNPGAVATSHYTNNTICVKDASSLLWGNTEFAFDYGGSTEEKTYSAMYVSGGSVLKSSGSSAVFTLGSSSSGNAVHIDGASRLEVKRGVTIGNAANAKYNVMTVKGGSAVTNAYDLMIGKVEGAEHNRLEFVDSEYYGGEYNGIYVGYQGSFNELVVCNSAIKRCYFCCAGFNASSSNNTVKMMGGASSIGGTKYETKLFGAGPNNTWVLDGCSMGNIDKPCYFAFTNNTSGEIAAVGNTFKLVNGAEFSQSSMYMNPSCASNMIFVGSGSAIKTKGDLNIRGTDNRVVVSNGTLYVSQSGNSMRFGKSAADDTEKGNALILQGDSPKVARVDPDNNYPSQFWNGSVLRFELPANGYSDVVFDRVEVKLHGTARLEFSGVEKCSYTIVSSQDYQLTSSPFTVLDANGADVTAAYLEQVSAELPPRCRVYRNASKYLYLRVACRRGTRLILR